MDNDISNEPASVGELVGRNAVDPDGDKIGSIFDVYVDNDTGQPQWLAISTGLFGTKVSFAPLAGASLVGDDVYVAYTKSHVKDAPRAEADGQLSPEEEDELYAHYGAPGVGTRRRHHRHGLRHRDRGGADGRRHDPLRGGARRLQDDAPPRARLAYANGSRPRTSR